MPRTNVEALLRLFHKFVNGRLCLSPIALWEISNDPYTWNIGISSEKILSYEIRQTTPIMP